MRVVAEKRDEFPLWEQWANAAMNLMPHLRGREFPAAAALLEDMRVVAEKRQETLPQWIKAILNLR